MLVPIEINTVDKVVRLEGNWREKMVWEEGRRKGKRRGGMRREVERKEVEMRWEERRDEKREDFSIFPYDLEVLRDNGCDDSNENKSSLVVHV